MKRSKIKTTEIKLTEIKDIKTSIEALLLHYIQISMLIYFNNTTSNPNTAFKKDINIVRYLIAEYADFITKENQLSFEQLEHINKYLLKDNIKLPYLKTDIDDNGFIEIFDFVYETYYKKVQDKILETSIRRNKITKKKFASMKKSR
ncbi:MAG: hypothetical protein ACI4N3_02670 [Alphaproteobacteria bacterium]